MVEFERLIPFLKFAVIDASASGNTQVVPAQSGVRYRVLQFWLTVDGAVKVRWQSGTTDICGPLRFAQDGTGIDKELNCIESIALLKFRSERELGLLTRYLASRRTAGAELVRYGRTWAAGPPAGFGREDLEPLVRYARDRGITDGNEAVRLYKAAKARGFD
jgi:hypothetical protein